MKRNVDLIREILLSIERIDIDGQISETDLGINEYHERVIKRHLQMMCDEKLIEGQVVSGEDEILVVWIRGITFTGYEFLDSIRDPKVWRQTKITLEELGDVGLRVITTVAAEVFKKMITGQ